VRAVAAGRAVVHTPQQLAALEQAAYTRGLKAARATERRESTRSGETRKPPPTPPRPPLS